LDGQGRLTELYGRLKLLDFFKKNRMLIDDIGNRSKRHPANCRRGDGRDLQDVGWRRRNAPDRVS